MCNVTFLATARTARIAQLNDEFRRTCQGERIILSQGIQDFRPNDVLLVVDKVRRFEDFNLHDDIYGHHDFGLFMFKGAMVVFKIDYYDPTFIKASENPASTEQTERVITIKLATEY